MPIYRDIVVPGLRVAGAWQTPLIIGGDATQILEDLFRTEALRLLRAAGTGSGFLFGCGIVAYDCDPANIIALREARDEFCSS